MLDILKAIIRYTVVVIVAIMTIIRLIIAKMVASVEEVKAETPGYIESEVKPLVKTTEAKVRAKWDELTAIHVPNQ